ncbi:type II toxin-antitoxin system HicB family antitoxin [Haloglomus litoreum]|uniref:type II toxin-antitoxin system HicB family antitoxin n=1 Tax=Haloglomus litoreum TaxID=3034026 RepID=UPI0023E78F48|nr:type II toxin-antitoxin system HicB family antitoxin [Haloglomus sp. DT116]
MSTGREIRLVENEDGWWTAIDEATGVASQGETREAALENLDEAVALHEGGGDPIEDEEAFLREVGIDPDDVEETKDLPEFMQ